MQRLVVILLVALINLGLVLCLRPSPPPDTQFWVMDNAERNVFYLFDASNTNTQNISTPCTLNGLSGFDATVASDGNIWFSTDPARLQAYDPVSRNCANLVDLAGSVASAHHISAGLGGKYLYYIGDGNIWRMNLVNYTTSLFLSAPSADVFFSGFGFQNGKMYSSLQYLNRTGAPPQKLNSYDYDVAKDEPIIPAATEDIWDAGLNEYRNSFYKFKKCPREPSYFCGQTTYATGQWVWSSLVNGSDSWIVLDTYSPVTYGGAILEYYTAPWGFMYATTDTPGLYSFDYTVANASSGSIFPFIIDDTGNPYGSFVVLIQAPDVSISNNDGVCSVDVYFNSYYWVTKFVIEVKNTATGLFEDSYSVNDVVVEDVEARYVSLPVVCDSSTKSFRIRYEGDTALSDNVYTLYTTVDCGCVSTPIAPVVDASVVPILECIDKVDETNFVVHLGYENLEDSAVYIPVGDYNKFSDVTDRSQPTVFRQGRTSFYPTSAFSFITTGASISWFLSYYQLPIDTQDTSVYCPSTLRVQLRFFYSIIDPNNQTIEAVRVAMAQFLKISETRVKVVNFQVTPTTTKRAGLAGGNNVTLEAEISAANPGSQEPSASDSVTSLVQASRNTTAADQIIDPGNKDPDSKVLGIKPLATGVEQSGTAQPGGKPRSPLTNTPVGTTSAVARTAMISIALSLIALIAVLTLN